MPVHKDALVKGRIYQLTYKSGPTELAVFRHISQTGLPIFHPPGEPDFQSCFGLNNFEAWVVEEAKD